jgi:CspA family cold shock protein
MVQTAINVAEPVGTPPDQPRNHRGSVLSFNEVKGYGFIRTVRLGRDVPVHQSAIDRAGLLGLFPGQVVEFDLVPWGEYHVRADNLRLIAAYSE